MTDLLIPFGISNKTNKIIEPNDAERGRACDCFCPGCGTPLLSRHPKDERVRIHFAHDSRHPEAVSSVIEECPFNSQLAVALMARSVAEQLSGALIHLPAMYTSVSYRDCIHEGYVQVTNETDLTIDNAFIEVGKFGSIFDLKLQFGDHQILVWLKYNGRPAPLLIENDKSELGSVGVLCIDIDTFDHKSFATEKKRFSTAVIEFLLSSGQREWIYHPKTKLVIEREKQKHNCTRESSVTDARRGIDNGDEFDFIEKAVANFSRSATTPQKAPKPALYQCVMCKAEWTHAIPGSPECPKECGRLYARKLG